MISLTKLGNDLYSGRRQVDFVGRRKVWYLFSAGLLALSIVSMLVQGLNFSLEFSGGTELRATGISSMDNYEERAQDVVRDAVGDQAVARPPHVTRIGDSTVRVQSGELGSEGSDNSAVENARLALAKEFGVSDENVTSSYIGPSWGKSVTNKAITALGVFLVLVAMVLALYFRHWKMSLAALVALIHDLIFTVGIYALFGFEISPASVIGFLTILGYSLYDTVVVFDKVRENTDDAFAHGRFTFRQAANHAINQTVVRSINTSVVALLPVLTILVAGVVYLGPGTLLDLSLALFVGIAVGAYSSIFLAPPLFVQLRELDDDVKEHDKRVLRWQAERGGAPTWDEDEAIGAGPSPAAAELAGVGSVGTRPAPDVTIGGRPLHPHARTGPRNQPRRAPKSRR